MSNSTSRPTRSSLRKPLSIRPFFTAFHPPNPQQVALAIFRASASDTRSERHMALCLPGTCQATPRVYAISPPPCLRCRIRRTNSKDPGQRSEWTLELRSSANVNSPPALQLVLGVLLRTQSSQTSAPAEAQSLASFFARKLYMPPCVLHCLASHRTNHDGADWSPPLLTLAHTCRTATDNQVRSRRVQSKVTGHAEQIYTKSRMQQVPNKPRKIKSSSETQASATAGFDE